MSLGFFVARLLVFHYAWITTVSILLTLAGLLLLLIFCIECLQRHVTGRDAPPNIAHAFFVLIAIQVVGFSIGGLESHLRTERFLSTLPKYQEAASLILDRYASARLLGPTVVPIHGFGELALRIAINKDNDGTNIVFFSSVGLRVHHGFVFTDKGGWDKSLARQLGNGTEVAQNWWRF